MKLGVTLEGGASRTVFSCGVMDVLMEENIMADYIIGASAGISYAVSYASRQKGRNLDITRKYMDDKRYMGARHLISPKNRGYYNLNFVYDELPNKLVPFDYVEFTNFKGEIIAVVTNIDTGKAEYLEVPRNDKTWQVLRASCALPILFPKIKIGGKFYMDGGVADSIPFEKAISEGCNKNIVVLTRERSYIKAPERAGAVAEILYRKHPDFVRAMKTRADRYNQAIKTLAELEKEGKVFVIAPTNTYGINRTENNPQKLEVLYNHGIKQTKKRMEELKAYLEK
ncbi:MAG: patatin family protein [Clostridiales bacterium]|nr:patatin family protein [Clostridiales bacterium]